MFAHYFKIFIGVINVIARKNVLLLVLCVLRSAQHINS